MSVLLLAVELAPYSYGRGLLAGAPIQNLGRFYILLKRIKLKAVSPALPRLLLLPMVLVQIPIGNER